MVKSPKLGIPGGGLISTLLPTLRPVTIGRRSVRLCELIARGNLLVGEEEDREDHDQREKREGTHEPRDDPSTSSTSSESRRSLF